jgi:hypothetical protein
VERGLIEAFFRLAQDESSLLYLMKRREISKIDLKMQARRVAELLEAFERFDELENYHAFVERVTPVRQESMFTA